MIEVLLLLLLTLVVVLLAMRWHKRRMTAHAERLNQMLPAADPAQEALASLQETHEQLKRDAPQVGAYARSFSGRQTQREQRIDILMSERAVLLRESRRTES